MKSSALIFFTAFVALAASWGGFVLAPQIQLGREGQTKTVGTGDLYPLARSGLAQQGLQVYRANGCVYCHSQQVRQTGTICEIILTDAGTNAAAVRATLVKLNMALAGADAIAGLPKTVLTVVDMNATDAPMKALAAAGAKAEVRIVAQGPDIARGWGRRHSVAQDYLFDTPVQPGTQRIGPDLANVGARLPDANWHLRHLYAPQNVVAGSVMPPYQFLFARRKLEFGRGPSADALLLPGELASPGYEIVPKPEARALVAYLLSLQADAPLFDAPVTPLPVAAPATNSPAK